MTIRSTLVVEAKDLDTDERTIATFNVEMPVDESGRRAQLVSVVGDVHPRARMRSFEDRAASFLDDRSLVVAHYSHTNEQVTPATSVPADRFEQQSLFAA